jgi:hypothetical protein
VKIQAILVAGVITLGASAAFAEPPLPGGRVLPPPEINSIVRSMGLVPTGRPIREGLTYAVIATDPRGRPVRVIIDARFGDVLSVRRVIAVGPPGAYPERLYGLAPWARPDFRPPGSIGRADPYSPYPPESQSRPGQLSDKPEQKSATAPAKPPAATVTIGPSAASRAADPKPTGSTAKTQSFPPAQSLE